MIKIIKLFKFFRCFTPGHVPKQVERDASHPGQNRPVEVVYEEPVHCASPRLRGAVADNVGESVHERHHAQPHYEAL